MFCCFIHQLMLCHFQPPCSCFWCFHMNIQRIGGKNNSTPIIILKQIKYSLYEQPFVCLKTVCEFVEVIAQPCAKTIRQVLAFTSWLLVHWSPLGARAVSWRSMDRTGKLTATNTLPKTNSNNFWKLMIWKWIFFLRPGLCSGTNC